MFSFAVTNKSGENAARCGIMQTPHGPVETPVFMPVGTRGTVKGILPSQLQEAGAQMILANTYHLLLRPGPEVVEQLGGLHGFMGWKGPILTDSGGFQVFSLSSLCRLGEDEVEFASHIDGAKVKLGPKSATQTQNRLGADIIMAFDECVSLPCPKEKMAQAVERTLRWAEQSLAAHERPQSQWMFGIVQGGTDLELREYCTKKLIELDFPGYAIGGLSVGETHEKMLETTSFTASLLPEEKPRYLMGVGTPRDLVAAMAAGVDMFDCVLPTRNGRHGTAFTHDGKLKLRNEQYKLQTGPLDKQCNCYTCRNFSRGYLRHLFMMENSNPEMLGPILVSLHNLTFYQSLMQQGRRAIRENRFETWAQDWLNYDANKNTD